MVAEALNFKRTEALSIGECILLRPCYATLNESIDPRVTYRLAASVFTDLNATYQGVALGIYNEKRTKDHEAGSAQPFVDIMGRRYANMTFGASSWFKELSDLCSRA